MTENTILESYAQQKFFTHASYLTGNSNNISTKIIHYPSLVTDQVFDVASLTKVFVTGSMLAQSMHQYQLSLDTPILQFSSWHQNLQIDKQYLQGITIGDLLSHTSGITSWFPLYALKNFNQSKIWNLFFFRAQKDRQRRYSDLGFICLGKILEELWNLPIEIWFQKYIIQKLNLKNTGYRLQLPHLQNSDFIPTSIGNPFEQFLTQKTLLEWEKDLQQANIDYFLPTEISFRHYRLQGECNDGNCFFLGQYGPHAGLFSTVEDLGRIIQHWLIEETSYAKYFKFLWELSNSKREYLFCTSHETLAWKPEAQLFGHHGFTGCSFSLDSSLSQFRIFLSNRQFYGLDDQKNYPPWKRILNLLMA